MAWLVLTIPEGRGPQVLLGAVWATRTEALGDQERQKGREPMATVVTIEVQTA